MARNAEFKVSDCAKSIIKHRNNPRLGAGVRMATLVVEYPEVTAELISYQRKKNTRYTQEDLQFAVREVEGGNSLSAVAAEFGIPKATLHGHTSGLCKHVGSGAPTVLQLQDEQEIVLTCQVLVEMGLGNHKEVGENYYK